MTLSSDAENELGCSFLLSLQHLLPPHLTINGGALRDLIYSTGTECSSSSNDEEEEISASPPPRKSRRTARSPDRISVVSETPGAAQRGNYGGPQVSWQNF